MVMLSQLAQSPFFDKLARITAPVGRFLAGISVVAWRNLVLFLLFLWVCHSAANLFWQLFPSPILKQPPVVAKPVAVAQAQTSGVINVDAIVAQHLFGELVGDVPVAQEEEQRSTEIDDSQNLATTNLNLKLHAVVASSNQQAARAIIANGSSQALYRVDEEIINGVKLAKILPLRVVLDNRGKLESLWLYDDEGEGFAKSREADQQNTAASTSREYNQRVVNQRVVNSGNNNRVKSSNSSSRTSGPVQTQPSAQKSQSRNSARSSSQSEPRKVVLPRAQIPKTIADSLRFSMHRVDGQIRGVKLRPGRDRTLFDQAGLKTNDVVTMVNGISMDDITKMRSIMQELKTATSADLEILRGEELLNINISVN